MKQNAIRVVITLLTLTLLALPWIAAQESRSDSFSRARAEGEKAYLEKSYAIAHSTYEKVDRSKLTAEQRRWVEFRLADTAWRADAAAERNDATVAERSRAALEHLIESPDTPHDETWARINESLGDFYWTTRWRSDSGRASTHYSNALSYWAAAENIELARERYLAIVWKLAGEATSDWRYMHGGNVPLDVARNAAKIAVTPDDRTRANLLVARLLRQQGASPANREAIIRAFEAAIAGGPSTKLHDDALFDYAMWAETAGNLIETAPNRWMGDADFERATELYKRLLSSYRKGESAYLDEAQNRLDAIISPSLSIAVPGAFLPDTKAAFHLGSRNVSQVDFKIFRTELSGDFMDGDRGRGRLALPRAGAKPVRTWSKQIERAADHRPNQELIEIDGTLPAGSYVIEASAPGVPTVKELLLVTSTAIIMKVTNRGTLAFTCDAVTGAPLPRIELLATFADHNGTNSSRWSGRSGDDGLVRIPFSLQNYGRVTVVAKGKQGDAVATTWAYFNHAEVEGRWTVYALTDRPAYRPDEEVQWKFTARRRTAKGYVTPSNESLQYEIRDPRGNVVQKGEAKLNEFGSMWGSLRTDKSMPLGMYHVQFSLPGNRVIAGTQLFRLEEYKLPEFKVSVEPARHDGKPRIFRPGDTVEALIRAEYYFGGPVANATVQVRVNERPFFPVMRRDREFAWYFPENSYNPYGYWNPGRVIKEETLRTGPDGTLQYSFETPVDGDANREYVVTARVVDASRREVEAAGTIRVSQQSYFVYGDLEHFIYSPGDRVRVKFKALDANENPVRKHGDIIVTREEWVEVWLDERGREIRGEELRRVREDLGRPAFELRHQLKSAGYEREEIVKGSAETNAEGEATYEFTVPREGYYRVTWSSDDSRPGSRFPIRVVTEVGLWVAREGSRFTGYHHEGIEVLIDRDTVKRGESVPVIVVTRDPGAHVLFTIEAEEILDARVLHLEGNMRVVQLPVEERFVPNVYLSASTMNRGRLLADTKELIVPPREEFLDVEMTTDRAVAKPGEEGSLTVTARDYLGRPVRSEVTVALSDQAVTAIQQEIAGDPRPFFYGQKRGNSVQLATSLQFASFFRLEEAEEKSEQRLRREDERGERFAKQSAAYGVEGGFVGGVANEAVTVTAAAPTVSDMAAQAAPAPPPPPPAAPAPPSGSGDAIRVRTDFRTTILWRPDLVTDADGKAAVTFRYPDSTTTWRATARAFSSSTQVGSASAETRTRRPVIARLQLPRFLVVGDSVTISGVINNNSERSLTLQPRLEAAGVVLADAGRPATKIGAGNDARVDWTVRADRAGIATFRLFAAGEESDAMELSIPVFDHGIEKLVARSGKLRSDSATIVVDLPKRREGSTDAFVQVTPSIAVTMLDALPYLIEYPYGCTEQTMSRFLPAAIVAKTLADLGVSRTTVEKRLFGGVEVSSAGKTHRDVPRSNIRKIDDVAANGLRRLYEFQHSDGGWGWWKEGSSDLYMTAYVVWGLALAREGGIEVRTDVGTKGADFLARNLVEAERNFATQAWMIHALAEHRRVHRSAVTKFELAALDNLWANRDKLQPYARALLALAAHYSGQTDRAQTLLRNLEDGVTIDRTTDSSVVLSRASDATSMATAHWGEERGWWRWQDGATESTAFVLRAFVHIDPSNRLVEPAMNWLVKNRRGAQWSNTKDTAITVLALNDYLRRSGELGGDVTFEVSVNGRTLTTKSITRKELIDAPSRFPIEASALRDGRNEIVIRRTSGTAPLYFMTSASFFSLEEPVAAEGHEIFVRRDYYRIAQRPTLLAGFIEERELLRDGAEVKSGDRIEVEATIEVKNDYEYLLFEDLKPAGFEAVALQSGMPLMAEKLSSATIEKVPARQRENTSLDRATGSAYLYQELRDRHVAFFADRLSQGVWRVRYQLRAQTPGSFHALPLIGQAMYVPELRGNSEEVRVKVMD